MILPKSKFKLIDRGFKDTLVLIPGWGTDYRIFDRLELNYNYILTLKADPFNFTEELSKFLKSKSVEKVSLFGWSLGGFLAVEFAANNSKKIEELILVGVKERFASIALEEVRQQLKKSKKSYLYKFYQAFFSPDDKTGYAWFKKHLLKTYLVEMELKDLLSGLDYLENARIDPKGLSAVKKIRVFQGKEDRIAPFKEALALKRKLNKIEFVSFPGAGHAPFLNPEFKDRIASSPPAADPRNDTWLC